MDEFSWIDGSIGPARLIGKNALRLIVIEIVGSCVRIVHVITGHCRPCDVVMDVTRSGNAGQSHRQDTIQMIFFLIKRSSLTS